MQAEARELYSNVEVSSASLSATISQLEAWCRVWQLRVNVSKTFVLHLGLNNPHFTYSFHKFNLISALTRDLDVEIDTVLSFDKITHCCTPWPADLFFNFTEYSYPTRQSESRPDLHIVRPLRRTNGFENNFFFSGAFRVGMHFQMLP